MSSCAFRGVRWLLWIRDKAIKLAKQITENR